MVVVTVAVRAEHPLTAPVSATGLTRPSADPLVRRERDQMRLRAVVNPQAEHLRTVVVADRIEQALPGPGRGPVEGGVEDAFLADQWSGQHGRVRADDRRVPLGSARSCVPLLVWRPGPE